MRWTLLVDPVGRPGWQNMALDQTLLDLAAGEGRGFLRLYRWDPSCLSFGRNEPALRRYDRGEIERQGLATVRRPTGGRAVWHADEVTYAMAAPAAALGSLSEAYRRIHEVLASALRTLGAEALLAGAPARASGVDAGACFASPAGGEVMLHGRKAIGSAQLREGGGLLQHGSILLGGSQAVVTAVTRGSPPLDASIGLSAAVGSRAEFHEVARAVAGAAAGAWGRDWDQEEADWPALQAGMARHGVRFQSGEWTWRR